MLSRFSCRVSGLALLLTGAAAGSPAALAAQQVDIAKGSVAATVQRLRAGQYVWAPEIAPRGPMLLIVNLKTQRAVLFRNGIPIGASTVSTGRPGYETPTGVFTILQKRVEHYSSTYDNAPMPYMQRLTWKGVALHAGHLPGYAASHGCIRLPAGFARLLYGETSLGMTVAIIDQAAEPRLAPTPPILASGSEQMEQPGEVLWTPEKSPSGPVSIVISAADRRAVVLRNGVEIGSAPVTVEGDIPGAWAYALRDIDAVGQHWIRLQLSPKAGLSDVPVARSEWQRFHAPEDFRRAVAAIVGPGTTVVVTPDSLRSGSVAQPLTVIDDSPGPK